MRDTAGAIDLYVRLTKVLWVVIMAALLGGQFLGVDGPWLPLAGLATFALIAVFVLGVVTSSALVTISRAAGELTDSEAVRRTMRPDAYADVLGVMAADRRPTASRLSPLLWMERATTRNDLAAIAASAHRQRDIEARATRMRAIASRSAAPPPAGSRSRRRRR